jgi:hypothetical protein
MLLVLGQDRAQVRPVQDQDPVQEFPAQGADEAFAEGVGLHRRLHPIQMIGTAVCG